MVPHDLKTDFKTLITIDFSAALNSGIDLDCVNSS